VSAIGIRRALRADAESLAALHREALPASLLTALGEAALVRYYAFVAESFDELAWVAHDHGQIVGGCVLSYAPGTVLRRFVRYDAVTFLRELGGRLLGDRALRRRLLGRGDGGPGTSDGPHAPEVTQIFTDARLRGRGIGAALLQACEAALRSRAGRKYYVHTHRDGNDAGIRFYRREGFVPTGESRSFGQAFLVMQKELA
jgi:GNAT superfamily N-acetyltransferase